MHLRRRKHLREALIGQKWATLIALPILIVAMLWELYAIWGMLFVFWGLSSMASGQVYLVEPIERREDPALFWIILGLWVGSGLLYIHTTAVLYM